MLRIFLIIVSAMLTACQATKVEPVSKSYYSGVKPEEYQEISPVNDVQIWVANRYLKLNCDCSDIEIFVNERRRWVPEFYLVVDTDPKSGRGFVNSDREGWRDISVESIEIDGVKFSHEIGYFDTLQVPAGEIQNIINQTPYTAPSCGLVRRLTSEDKKYSISVVDSISCGEFSSALRGKESLKSLPKETRDLMTPYIQTLDQRIEILRAEERTAYGFL
ncbi:hypothetical protein [Gynuella sunshinyii]|uniref:Lipoprotein n=1 Tax=Gynuella sunshinyii YC6258 TaxID=1445510 RepID=A0A0C5VMT1_9GAMM|nr:hypothetical protein [Gynuella sunshinyii]AJQ95616.1 hypothetical Protein YC6258_03580 [Gynuella sunshinyii YC6258]